MKAKYKVILDDIMPSQIALNNPLWMVIEAVVDVCEVSKRTAQKLVEEYFTPFNGGRKITKEDLE